MHIPRTFLSLPPSLLLLLATQIYAQPEKKDDESALLPTAVRKMSLDESEKFMQEYYAFAPEDSLGMNPQIPLQLAPRRADFSVLTPEEDALLALNSSVSLAFRPPFPRHYDYRTTSLQARSNHRSDEDKERELDESAGDEWLSGTLYRRAKDALARLQGREFTCPGGTHVCSNIDRPNYCCADGTRCFVVENAPNAGNVGCCPEGHNCIGNVASCPDGNTACPAEEGGGCCIPGFVCADVGCIASSVTVVPPTTSSKEATSTYVEPSPTTTTTTREPTSTTSPKPTTSETTSHPTRTTPSPSPTSDSGSVSGTGLPPVRPTSSSPETLISGPTSQTSDSGPYCPTGFYACLASAGSGCCRTGRDCSTTSCPPMASTTITGNGITVVVPVTDALDARPHTKTACASGWFLCGKSAGALAGCCPSGYACGTASCTLSAATATATVQKELPGNAAASKPQGQFLLAIITTTWTVIFSRVVVL
ncbi:hypothetical protein GGS20DRAFT_439751 [Poronia punctata]|nr:hypothetical protein GGS20DRAFT_439751 [Poronia punctata]